MMKRKSSPYRRILVTGDRGFIGSHLKRRLKELGHSVFGFDRDFIPTQYPNVDVVFHMAATNGTRGFYKKPYDVEYNDTKITLDIVNHYKDKDTRIIFASSSEIYNDAYFYRLISPPFTEDSPVCYMDPHNPRWSYSIPKLLGETLLENARAQYGTDYLTLRYFNVYGPGQKDHFIPEFIERCLVGKSPYIVGNDKRCYIYIDDAVNITIDLALREHNEHNVYNVGTDQGFSSLTVANLICKYLGMGNRIIENREGFEGSPDTRVPDISRTKDLIYKYGDTSLAEGLRKTISWHSWQLGKRYWRELCE